MWRLFVLCFLVLACKPADAQVDFVKRSELWGYTMGKEVGKGLQHHQDFQGSMRERDEEYRKLDALQQRVAKCGNCADKNKLTAEANALEKRLVDADRQLCRGFSSQADSNPAVGAMSKLLGVAPICDKLEAQSSKASTDARVQGEKQDFDSKVKAGDTTAYSTMGQNMMSRRDLPIEERQRLACPYWFQGARKGDVTSATALASLCLGSSASEKDRKEGFDLVKRCADKGEVWCIYSLGEQYASTSYKNSARVVPADDEEALRLWDMAAAKGNDSARLAATALRAKLQKDESSSEPKAVEVAETLPAAARESGTRRPGASIAADRGATRCRNMATVVERIRGKAEAGNKMWTDVYERQKQQYARECGGQ